MRKYLTNRCGAWSLMILIVIAVGMLCACSQDDEDNLEQKSDIESYLEGSHDPTLIPESEVGSAVDVDPPFYTMYGDYAYRYIATYYDEGRDSMTEIVNGSRVSITFEIYSTTTGAITSGTLPEYTNNPALESDYVELGLNTQYWDFTPVTITIGSDHLLSSLNQGLVGCREGDLIEFYLTSNMAYGENVIGLVDEGSALLIACYIESVEN